MNIAKKYPCPLIIPNAILFIQIAYSQNLIHKGYVGYYQKIVNESSKFILLKVH